MTFMPWSDELHTGIAKVDEQHKWLIEATNRLHEEVTKPACNQAVVGKMLQDLVGYTFKHFIMEEDLFKRLGYPESDAHLAQHNVFTYDITGLLERHNKGETVSVEALEPLKEWLLDHIMKTDMAYVPFLKEKGVV